MISSRNDWNGIAGADIFLKLHTGGGYRSGINTTSYTCFGVSMTRLGEFVRSFSAPSFGGFVYSGDTMFFRQHRCMLSFLRARNCFARRALRVLARESIGCL